MTIQHAIRSLKIFGIHGCYNYLMRMIRHSSDIAKWEKHLIINARHIPTPGITVIGTLSGAGSLSKVLRDFCICLKQARIPYQAFNTGCDNPIPESEYISLLTPLDEFKLNKYSDIVGMYGLPSLPRTKCRQSRIGFWEFESGLAAAYPHFAEPGSLIVNSDFNLTTFKAQLPHSVNVHKILYPFQFIATKAIEPSTIRKRYNIAPGSFMVFYNFDYCSGYRRKNPEAAVKAFAIAFKEVPSAVLVFKTQSASQQPQKVKSLMDAIVKAGITEKVRFVDTYITQDDLIGLTNACDVYLSLHHGEGFGLGIAEAMTLGKPVVVTAYSAPTEFCNVANSMLVPYRMAELKSYEKDIWQYEKVKTWAEPDINAAASALRKLYEDRTYARQLGDHARASIAEQFSIRNFKASVEAFLNR